MSRAFTCVLLLLQAVTACSRGLTWLQLSDSYNSPLHGRQADIGRQVCISSESMLAPLSVLSASSNPVECCANAPTILTSTAPAKRCSS
jgi:hypothetical protein